MQPLFDALEYLKESLFSEKDIKKQMPAGFGKHLFFFVSDRLRFVNSVVRANTCTSSAIQAFICVDYIDIALRNSFNRTFANASSASYTIVVYYVSHSCKNFKLDLLVFNMCSANVALFSKQTRREV